MANSAMVGLLRVLLTANTGDYSAAMKRASADTKGWLKDVEDAGKKAKDIGAGMTKALTLPIVAGLAASGKAFLDFNAAMTESTAIMGDVSTEMRAKMEVAARDVAKTTTFSAKQAADAYFFLASAGLDAAQSIEAMPKVAAFAQAGNFDLARATDLLTDAQSALGMTIRDDVVKNMENMSRVSDVLVKANELANASVAQFSESLTNKAGAALRLVNKDVEEGVAVLAVYADQGVKGAEAGEKLNIVMRDLQTAALKKKAAFKDLGISVFDSSGNMRNMADIVADLEKAMHGMSDAQRRSTMTMLGFQDRSVSALTALLGTSEAIRKYETQLRSAAGITDEVAKKQLESFKAQLSLVWSRITDVGIVLGQSMVPAMQLALGMFHALFPIVEMLARAVAALPAPIQLIGLGLLGLVAAAGPAVYLFGQLVLSGKAIASVLAASGNAAQRAAIQKLQAVAAERSLEVAQLRVAKATAALDYATVKHGATSLQAAKARDALAGAELRVAKAQGTAAAAATAATGANVASGASATAAASKAGVLARVLTSVGVSSAGAAAVTAKLGGVIAALLNPIGLAIAGAGLLGYTIYKLVTAETELEKAAKANSKAFIQKTNALDSALRTYDALKDKQNRTTEETKQLEDATRQLAQASGLSTAEFDKQAAASGRVTATLRDQLVASQRVRAHMVEQAEGEALAARAQLKRLEEERQRLLRDIDGAGVVRYSFTGTGAPVARRLTGDQELAELDRLNKAIDEVKQKADGARDALNQLTGATARKPASGVEGTAEQLKKQVAELHASLTKVRLEGGDTAEALRQIGDQAAALRTKGALLTPDLEALAGRILAVGQSGDKLSAALAKANGEIRLEVASTGFTVQELVRSLGDYQEELGKAGGSAKFKGELGLTTDTMRFLDAQLKKTAQEAKAAGKDLKKLAEDVAELDAKIAARSDLSLAGLTARFGDDAQKLIEKMLDAGLSIEQATDRIRTMKIEQDKLDFKKLQESFPKVERGIESLSSALGKLELPFGAGSKAQQEMAAGWVEAQDRMTLAAKRGTALRLAEIDLEEKRTLQALEANKGADALAYARRLELAKAFYQHQRNLALGTTGDINDAFAFFGITARAELEETARKAVEAFRVIQQSGTATPKEIADAHQKMRQAIDAAADNIIHRARQAGHVTRQELVESARNARALYEEMRRHSHLFTDEELKNAKRRAEAAEQELDRKRKAWAQFKAQIEADAKRLGHDIASVLGDNIATGDWTQWEQQLADSLANFMGSAMARAVDLIVPGLGQILEPLFKGISSRIMNALFKTDHIRTNDVRDKFLAQFGGTGTGEGSGFHELSRQLHALGPAGDALFQRVINARKVEDFEAAMADVNEALGDARKEMSRLSSEGGTASRQMIAFRDATRESAETLAFIKSEAQASADSLSTFLQTGAAAYTNLGEAQKKLAELQETHARSSGADRERLAQEIATVTAEIAKHEALIHAVGIASQQAATGIGAALAGAVGELQAQGVPMRQIIADLGPGIAAFKQQLEATGFSGGEAFQFISDLATVAAHEIAGPALDAVNQLGRGLMGAHNAGFLTQEMFDGLIGQILHSRQAILDQGVSSEHVNALMQRELQSIWQLQKDFGYEVDEATQAMLDEAEAAGKVGDRYRSAMDRAAIAMEKVADSLSKLIDRAGGLGEALDKATKPRTVRVGFDVDAPPSMPGSETAQTAATGGLVSAMGRIIPAQHFAVGGLVNRLGSWAGRFTAFVPKGKDTVPAMLSPGELILNEGQKGNIGRALQLGMEALDRTFSVASSAAHAAGVQQQAPQAAAQAGDTTYDVEVHVHVAGNIDADRAEEIGLAMMKGVRRGGELRTKFGDEVVSIVKSSKALSQKVDA